MSDDWNSAVSVLKTRLATLEASSRKIGQERDNLRRQLSQQWRCFHCGEWFDQATAPEHFGRREDADPPTCIISTKHPLVVRLRAKVGELDRESAEWKIRASPLPWIVCPERHHGARSAYTSGFENGYRGWPVDFPYVSPKHALAYQAGIEAGNNAVIKALAEVKS